MVAATFGRTPSGAAMERFDARTSGDPAAYLKACREAKYPGVPDELTWVQRGRRSASRIWKGA